MHDYSTDCNPGEAIWGWTREKVTADTILGTRVAVQEKLAHAFADLADRTDEVQSRCRRTLQGMADGIRRADTNVAAGGRMCNSHPRFSLGGTLPTATRPRLARPRHSGRVAGSSHPGPYGSPARRERELPRFPR